MYERYDSFIGTIIATNAQGCYVEAEDEQRTTGFFFGGGQIGDRVLCTVKKETRPFCYLVALDSVLSFAPVRRYAYAG